ncbi:Synaptotagmin-3 [Dichanthelium oligosanthes]|uniref:Synaptotagmin-3 n=1 Tax=Dichanthelium oligosanthes TaxID=888268 RepID=A0A1E5VAG2_9POAL|nr:Synaptotagmin-3 [Dichanthelium oligosanthes]
MGLVGGVLGFCLGLPIGLAAAYFLYLRYFAAPRLQDPVIRPLRDLDSEALQTTIPDIPLWVKSPDYERVDWMNKFIFDMWPFLDKAICNNIKRVTRPIFDQYVGQYGIESIEFGQLTLGALPPTLQDVGAARGYASKEGKRGHSGVGLCVGKGAREACRQTSKALARRDEHSHRPMGASSVVAIGMVARAYASMEAERGCNPGGATCDGSHAIAGLHKTASNSKTQPNPVKRRRGRWLGPCATLPQVEMHSTLKSTHEAWVVRVEGIEGKNVGAVAATDGDAGYNEVAACDTAVDDAVACMSPRDAIQVAGGGAVGGEDAVAVARADVVAIEDAGVDGSADKAGEAISSNFLCTFSSIKVYEMVEKELVIEPVIRWASIANVIVNAKVHSFKVSVQLEDLHIMLTPRVILKPLVPSFPCFSNLCISLMEKDQISKQISILYHWPKVIQIPILDGASGATNKPVGILHVKVIRALNLLKMDLLGKSDPYVKMRLSGERLPSKKTSVKMSNLNPEWNEHFRFIVKDPDTQVLELHMFDWEKVKMHDKLGMQVVPLRLLTPYESKQFELDLVRSMNPNDAQNKKNRGKLIVELTFDPFREDNSRTSLASDGEGNASVRREGEGESSSGVLLVSVENAEDVEGKQHTNPYAEVLFRGERKKTKVIRKTRDPRWSEEFQFMVDEPPMEDKIHIEVKSKRRGLPFRNKASHESLGHVDINLADVVNNGRINEKYHLINSRNGMIQVEIRWSTV